jgi:hypothetical protein
MSKKYDKYLELVKEDSTSIFPGYLKEVTPMIPVKDPELDREIRDRMIINIVTTAVKSGKELSYGDIRILVDNNYSEKEYEDSKSEQMNNSKSHSNRIKKNVNK